MKGRKEKKEELVERILDEIYTNMHAYWDFVLDCVRQVVSSWSEEELREFLGEDEDC